MVITKTKVTTYNVLNVVVDFSVFDERWKSIRGNYKYKGFECFNCNKHFDIGDKISLIFTDKGNRTICHDCAECVSKEINK